MSGFDDHVRETVAKADPAGLDAARRLAQWEIGDEDWADQIVAAYLSPAVASEHLDGLGAE